MFLAIDVGNTETKLGAFATSGSLAATWRITTGQRRTADEYGILFTAFFAGAHFPMRDVGAIIIAAGNFITNAGVTGSLF